MSAVTSLPESELLRAVQLALAEDLGRGDVTSRAIVPPDLRSTGTILFRSVGVVCGLPVVDAVFRQLDPAARLIALVAEGSKVAAGTAVARLEASALAMLGGERVALNFLARMAATASLARRFAEAVAGTHAQILDTRKTTPGLRALEKYAVRVGGARNHRIGLDDGVLIKDNHVQVAGSITEALRRARAAAPIGLRIEVEVESLEQLREALSGGADMILLDNMPVDTMRDAVAIAGGRVPLEASGGISLESVRAIAETGVEFISAGALTHSAGSVDVSLEVL